MNKSLVIVHEIAGCKRGESTSKCCRKGSRQHDRPLACARPGGIDLVTDLVFKYAKALLLPWTTVR